jgi:hypothetical protein
VPHSRQNSLVILIQITTAVGLILVGANVEVVDNLTTNSFGGTKNDYFY